MTQGDAATEIVRHARLMQADLIAVAMHAEDGRVSPLVTHLALDAPCPVLVVNEESAAPTRGEGLDRVLLAVDFLPASLAAADYAVALARTVRAQVTVVHVLPGRWEGPPRDDTNIHEARRFLERHFRQLLQIAVDTASGVRRDRRAVVVSGRPCVEIVRLATVRQADLIVMGINASSKLARALGETTNCMLQFAGKSVLLVPEPTPGAP